MRSISPMKCTGCSTEFPFPRGNFVYTDLAPTSKLGAEIHETDANERPSLHYWGIPLLLNAWCLHCDRATYVERVPSVKELENAAGIRKLRDKNARHEFDDDLLYLDEDSFRALHGFCVNRTATPKCVLCGKSSYIIVDQYGRDTGLKHGECWGSPITGPRFFIGSSVGPPNGKIRFLNHNGEQLWATTNSYKIFKYWLEAVLHIPATHPGQRFLRKAINAIIDGELEFALKLIEPYCDDEDACGLGIMGALHYIGEGVAHDGQRARDLLTTAMEQGDLGACHNLASLYCTGAPGIERDIAKGWELFHHAKKIGAQFKLNDFYEMGQDDFYPHFRP